MANGYGLFNIDTSFFYSPPPHLRSLWKSRVSVNVRFVFKKGDFWNDVQFSAALNGFDWIWYVGVKLYPDNF